MPIKTDVYLGAMGNLLKQYLGILLLIFITVLAACNNQAGITSTSKQEQKKDCTWPTDKKAILSIGQSVLNQNDNDFIWNLSAIDTIHFFSSEDYFTNSKTKNKLVLLGGSAGSSAGTAHNLLMLFSCTDTSKVLWAGQVAPFSETDLVDLNGDGIKEICIQSDVMWMGECHSIYEIFNFKDEKQNMLFKAHSTSVIDCGSDHIAELYAIGDTLENKLDCTLMKLSDKEYVVQQIRTLKIHHGGQTDTEMLRNLKVLSDTSNVYLK